MKAPLRFILMAVLGAIVIIGGIHLAFEKIEEIRLTTIRCALAIGRTVPSEGLITGYQWDLIHRMAKEDDAVLDIVNVGSHYEPLIDSLKRGSFDVIILKAGNDSLLAGNDSIIRYAMLDSTIVWAISNNDSDKAEKIVSWLDEFHTSGKDSVLRKTYYATFDPYKRATSGLKYETVCPYDSLIRKYAAEIKWDWKMLAAVIYKESKYDIGATSHRGAEGLMQIVPATSKRFNVTESMDPEQSIKAGTAYLGRLERMFRKYAKDKQELYKFALAAYNAGEGRIMDCINYADSRGTLDGTWGSIVETIPEMREEEILEDENVKLGMFQGYETIGYVDAVMTLYSLICQTTEP